MRLGYLESPYAGEVEANIEYARRCMKDCLDRGEAPFASHLLYTQPDILDDTVPEEREKGMAAGFAWAGQAEATVVYTDRGITRGMSDGMIRAIMENRPVEHRSLDTDDEVVPDHLGED